MQPTLLTSVARRLPRFIYKFLAQRWIDYRWPRHLHIEVTQKCQLSCNHCPRPKEEGDMDYELFKKIIDEATEYGPRSFSLHLFGEPLLWGRIREGILYIKKRDRRHTVIITTNGILLNEFCQSLIDCGVDKIIWTYRRLGANKFTDKTIHSLRKIAVCRILKETMQEEDWKEADKIAWKKEVKNLHNYGGSVKSEKNNTKRYPCYHLWMAPAVRWNGDFTICCNDPKGKEVIGNINEHSIKYYWKSIDIHMMRYFQLNDAYVGICENCDCWQTYPNIW